MLEKVEEVDEGDENKGRAEERTGGMVRHRSRRHDSYTPSTSAASNLKPGCGIGLLTTPISNGIHDDDSEQEHAPRGIPR